MNMTAVAIVAIICWAIVELTSNKRRSSLGKKSEAELKQKIDELQERIVTLEKIVTDEKYNLNKQFEDLKKQ